MGRPSRLPQLKGNHTTATARLLKVIQLLLGPFGTLTLGTQLPGQRSHIERPNIGDLAHEPLHM
jgi:hypothetical protein